MTYTYNESGVTYNQTGVTYDGDPVGLSNLPVVGVFVAFDDGPYVADPDWVEVTDYVRDINIRRGRQDDLQQFPSGSCSITFDNRDRLFDPFNTAGTYYGKLKPRRQVRVVGQWNGVNYPLFRGFVAGWPVEFTDGGKDSTVTVDCFDLLGLFATDKTPVDFITQYTLSLSPTNYYKIDEGQNATQFANQMTTSKVLQAFSATTSTSQIVKASPAQSIYAPQLYSNDVSLTTVGPVSMSFWMLPQPSADQRVTYDRFAPRLFMRFQTGSTTVQANYSGNRYVATVAVDDRTLQLGEPTHFVCTFNNTGNTFTVYVNGVAATLSAVTTASDLYIASYEVVTTRAAVQEVSTYSRVLSASEALLLYQYGIGNIQELSSARVSRVLSTSQIPSALTSVATGEATVTDLYNGQERIRIVQDAVTSENGEWFADASGVLQFVNRGAWASRSRSNTSQVSFTDTGTGVYYDAGSVRMNLDADQVRNDVQVSFSGGGQVDAQSQTSIDDVGAASEQIATLLPTSTAAQTLADYRVSIYKNPKLRVEPFLVKGQRNPSYDWPRLLNLELLDRFTFVRTPSVGSAIQRDMLLQSVEHRITPGTWETTINGSARYTGWFILGVSLLGSTEDVLL